MSKTKGIMRVLKHVHFLQLSQESGQYRLSVRWCLQEYEGKSNDVRVLFRQADEALFGQLSVVKAKED